jgi:hypothetical protein
MDAMHFGSEREPGGVEWSLECDKTVRSEVNRAFGDLTSNGV